MFNDIINDMIDRLTNAGVRHIYSAFDSLPVIGKGGSFYTVVGINGFTAGRPVYSQFAAYIPYTMRMEFTVTAPENCPLSRLYSYFEEEIFSRLNDMADLDHYLTNVSVKPLSSISRLSLCAEVTFKGMYKAERED